MSARERLSKPAERLLARLAAPGRPRPRRRPRKGEGDPGAEAELIAAALAVRRDDGQLAATAEGQAAARRAALARAGHDPFVGQHLALSAHQLATPLGKVDVTMDESESPLVWLAKHTGRDGRAMISPVQLMAGERLRADFTRAQMMPRTTSNWAAPVAVDGGAVLHPTDAMVAARQRVNLALAAVGPEFAGLLIDVCCFIKGLAEVERERAWPLRSAKVVLQLGLDRLARHYGLTDTARGRAKAEITTWLAPDAGFCVDGEAG